MLCCLASVPQPPALLGPPCFFASSGSSFYLNICSLCFSQLHIQISSSPLTGLSGDFEAQRDWVSFLSFPVVKIGVMSVVKLQQRQRWYTESAQHILLLFLAATTNQLYMPVSSPPPPQHSASHVAGPLSISPCDTILMSSWRKPDSAPTRNYVLCGPV